MMVDPITAHLVAGICLAGLKLAVSGLKGLFKWIRRWLARKLKLSLFPASYSSFPPLVFGAS
jgi:hypothetical protein